VTEWIYHPELLATPVPRYTSYPTAAEFTDAIGPHDVELALEGIGADQSLSLYVHIPYCHEICWYCGCNTGAANRTRRLASYLEALESEIGLVAKRLAGRGKIGRISFGGGSPNAISPIQFAELLTNLQWTFDAHDALPSIELDPRSLGDAWFDAIAAARIERASLGVQTFEPDVQHAIGRIQPFSMIEMCVAKLRQAGVRSLNFDLMYGLPNQGLDELERTLRATIALRPERIALFGYAHVPGIIPRQRQIDSSALPDAEQRFGQAELGHRLLVAAGYEPIGFDHFALPDDPLGIAAEKGALRRNFQGFTDDQAEVLVGLGASAISQFPQLLVQNEKNAGRYKINVSSGRLPADRGVIRSAADQRRGRIIERLLCNGKTEVDGIVDQELLERLRPFLERGLATLESGRLRLPDYGRPYARVIASLFDSYRQPAARQFSSAI
jgi:oxygen-independent coproporphyrinogen-3 oxidase